MCFRCIIDIIEDSLSSPGLISNRTSAAILRYKNTSTGGYRSAGKKNEAFNDDMMIKNDDIFTPPKFKS